MNGNSTKNLAIASLAAAALTPYAEKHWNVKIDADTVVDIAAALFTGWHVIASAIGPYAERVFDHYFPPQPTTGEKRD